VIGIALLLIGTVASYRWYVGTPYQAPYRSPNDHYYVQKYATLSLSSLVGAMPGQGSDTIDGFIRLHAHDGAVLAERWVTFMRDIKPVWADDRVYLLGVAEMDNDPWLLPSSATNWPDD